MVKEKLYYMCQNIKRTTHTQKVRKLVQYFGVFKIHAFIKYKKANFQDIIRRVSGKLNSWIIIKGEVSILITTYSRYKDNNITRNTIHTQQHYKKHHTRGQSQIERKTVESGSSKTEKDN